MSVMMALGPFTFSIRTAAYRALERRRQQRMAHHTPIAGPVITQILGPGNETMRLEGTIYPHYRGGGNVPGRGSAPGRGSVPGEGGLAQIEGLRALARATGAAGAGSPLGALAGALGGAGSPLGALAPMLTGASGTVFGRHCVTRVGDTQTHFAANGSPARIDFTLELQCTGEQ